MEAAQKFPQVPAEHQVTYLAGGGDPFDGGAGEHGITVRGVRAEQRALGDFPDRRSHREDDGSRGQLRIHTRPGSRSPHGQAQRYRTEPEEPVRVRDQSSVQLRPCGAIAFDAVGATCQRMVEDVHLAAQCCQVDGTFRVRSGREEHRAIHSRLVQGGEVASTGSWTWLWASMINGSSHRERAAGMRQVRPLLLPDTVGRSSTRGKTVLIGELAERTGTSERLLRYYDRVGLLRPERRPNGYRFYDEDPRDGPADSGAARGRASDPDHPSDLALHHR